MSSTITESLLRAITSDDQNIKHEAIKAIGNLKIIGGTQALLDILYDDKTDNLKRDWLFLISSWELGIPDTNRQIAGECLVDDVTPKYFYFEGDERHRSLPSGTFIVKKHKVKVPAWGEISSSCDCKDFHFHGERKVCCKHLVAVAMFIARGFYVTYFVGKKDNSLPGKNKKTLTSILKRDAIISLSKIGTPEIIPHILGASASEDVYIRESVADGLRFLDSKEAIKILVGLLLDAEKQVKHKAIESLSYFTKKAKYYAFLEELLQSSSEKQQIGLMEAIRYSKSPNLIPLITPFLKQQDTVLAYQAIDVLGSIKDIQSFDSLVSLLENHTDEIVFRKTIYSLVKNNGAMSVPHLIRSLFTKPSTFREFTEVMVGLNHEYPKILNKLIDGHLNWDQLKDFQIIRPYVIILLGKLKDKRALCPLYDCINYAKDNYPNFLYDKYERLIKFALRNIDAKGSSKLFPGRQISNADLQKFFSSRIEYDRYFSIQSVTKPPMNHQTVAIPLKRFLLIDQCPADWKGLDLYLFRDGSVVFYVGQSYLAFARVWEHLIGGFRGNSIMGRFVWCNWPRSMKFTIELLSSQSAQFEGVGHDLNAAEQALIQRWMPCFNVSLNSQPTPIPVAYLPPNARLRCARSLNKLIHEAERVVKAEDTEILMQETG